MYGGGLVTDSESVRRATGVAYGGGAWMDSAPSSKVRDGGEADDIWDTG